MMEVALQTKPNFLINTTQTPDGKITGIFAGDLEKMSIGEVVQTIIQKPTYFIQGIFSIQHILLALGLIIIFLGLPL